MINYNRDIIYMKDDIKLIHKTVHDSLEEYGKRGLFNGIRGIYVNGNPEYHINWHYHREIILRLIDNDRLIVENILPNIHHYRNMENNFRKFVDKFSSADMVAHRRIDREKLSIAVKDNGENTGIECRVIDEDIRYAISSILDVVHSIFLEFIPDGPYYEYQVQELGLDQDSIRLG